MIDIMYILIFIFLPYILYNLSYEIDKEIIDIEVEIFRNKNFNFINIFVSGYIMLVVYFVLLFFIIMGYFVVNYYKLRYRNKELDEMIKLYDPFGEDYWEVEWKNKLSESKLGELFIDFDYYE